MMFLFSRTEDMKALDKFAEHCVQTMSKRQEEGCTEALIWNDLCQTSLQKFPSKDTHENKKEGSGSPEKKERKTTAVIWGKAWIRQMNKPNDNTAKENVNYSQVTTAWQESRKGKGKRQQASAEQSTANNMGQLMFASKYYLARINPE